MKRRIILLSLLLLFVFSGTVAKAQAAWAPNTAYAVGALVTYQDATHPNHIYKCIQAHTSQVGWEPPNVPALWGDQGAVGTTSTSTPTTAPTKTNTPIGATATRTPTKTNTP